MSVWTICVACANCSPAATCFRRRTSAGPSRPARLQDHQRLRSDGKHHLHLLPHHHRRGSRRRRHPARAADRNTTVYILDEAMEPVPSWRDRRALSSAATVWRADYWRQPELTAAKFVPNPFSKNAGARLYKSGDLGALAGRRRGRIPRARGRPGKGQRLPDRAGRNRNRASPARGGARCGRCSCAEPRHGRKEFVAYVIPAAMTGAIRARAAGISAADAAGLT